jgi:hypothetical protein
MFATATFSPITRNGFSASHCDAAPNGRKRGWWGWWDVLPVAPQDLCLEEGEFALEDARGSRLIARATGRTRWFGSHNMATLEVFDIDTVVEMVGDLPVIVGKRGNRLPGTWKTSTLALKIFP